MSTDYLQNLREKLGHDLLLMPAVTMLTFDQEGRLLLIKHAEGDQWLPPGGAVEPDEMPADAAVREMWEETGLLVEPVRVFGVYGGPEFHVTYGNQDQVSYVGTVFECRVVGGEMRPDGVETLDVAYFSAAELAALALPAWVELVLADIADDDDLSTQFQPPTWRPPADGVRKGGISDYFRDVREKVGHALLHMPAAAAIIFNAEGHILLQKRSDNGRWAIPGGGIDPHESPSDAAVREVWEETGLLVAPTRVTGIYNGPEFYITYSHGDQVAVYSFVFECEIVGGEMSPDGDETLDLRFFTPEEIGGDFLPKRWRRRVIDALARRNETYFDPPSWQPPTGPLLQNG